jgi:hypothetical protein
MREEDRPEAEVEEKEKVNPAARRDAPGEPSEPDHSLEPEEEAPPRGYQKARLDPRDQGGIAE